MEHDDGSQPGQLPADRALLGLELRRLRRARGLSQRATARLIGLSSPGAVADYESGRRTPPGDILAAYERQFEVADRALRRLRESALAARADREHGDAVALQCAQSRPQLPAEPAEPDVREAPAAVPAAAPEPSPAPVRGASRRRFPRAKSVRGWGWVAVATTAAAGATAAVMLFVLPHGHRPAGLDSTWDERTQHVTDRHQLPQAPEDMDGDDPRARDCTTDVTTEQSVPFRLPDGTAATLRLRHSRHCGTSWASALYANPRLYTVVLTTHRPADGAELIDPWGNNTPPGSYGDMLSTAKGCVWAEVGIADGSRKTTLARTRCVM